MKEMLPISDRIKGLPYKYLDSLFDGLFIFDCGGLDCNDCPFKIKGQLCIATQVIIEHSQRKA